MQDHATYNAVLLEYEPCQYRINFRSEIVKVEVLTAVTLKITVFWDRMLCTLKMEVADLSGRSIYTSPVYLLLSSSGYTTFWIYIIYPTKWRHVPEDSHFQNSFLPTNALVIKHIKC